MKKRFIYVITAVCMLCGIVNLDALAQTAVSFGDAEETITHLLSDTEDYSYSAEFEDGSTYKYVLDEDKNAIITGYTGTVSNLIVPDTLKGHKVVSIESQAFKNCSFRYLELPEGIITIGSYAFSGCKYLSTVKLPKTLEIMDCRAFQESGLTNIEVSAKWKEVDRPFDSCASLKTVTFEEGITEILPELFSGCSGLENITLPEGVTKIGENAFSGCVNLKTVTLPKTLETMGYGAFSSSGLVSVEIPKSLSEVEFPFWDCRSLVNILFEEGTTKVIDTLFGWCNGLTEIVIPEGITNIDAKAFQSCENLSSVQLPESLEGIEEYAFSETGITNVEIIKRITYGKDVYSYCEQLQTVIIEEGVKEIPNGLFRGCGALTEVNLPNSLEIIGSDAFSGAGLASVYIPKSLKSGDFGGCDALVTVTFEEGTESINDCMFLWCESLKEVNMPDSIQSIGERAFADCANLENIKLPKALNTLGEKAFYQAGLISIEIPKELKKVSTPFNDCSKLKTISFEEGTTEIIDGLFEGCSGLEDIVIQEGIIKIGRKAFYECSKLKAVKLPKTLEEIGDYAFGRTGLTGIVIPKNLKSVGGWYTFYKCDSLQTVKFEKGTTEIIDNLFSYCTSLKEITIPDGVTCIGEWAFYNCTSLMDIVIPGSVVCIDNDAFRNCSSLSQIEIPEGVIEIGSGAFSGCSNLTKVTLPQTAVKLKSDWIFPEEGGFTIYGLTGTYAEEYAERIGVEFVSTGERREIPAKQMSGVTEESTTRFTVPFNIGEVLTKEIELEPVYSTDIITWSSSDQNVVEVTGSGWLNTTGTMRMKEQGSATVTATTTSGIKMNWIIEVLVPVTEMELRQSEITLSEGKTYTLNAMITPENSKAPIRWYSSNNSVASVSDDGVVTAKSTGTTTITAEVWAGWYDHIYATCEVTVLEDVPSTKITLNAKNVTVNKGKSYSLKANMEPLDTTDIVTWTSSNPKVAKVSEKGVVTAVTKGTATIVAKTTSGKTATCKVTVKEPAIRIKLNKTKVTINKGKTYTLKATLTPGTSTDKVTWTSSNMKVAKVSAKGVVKAVAKGTATITAKTTSGKMVTCKVTVKVPSTKIKLNKSKLSIDKGKTYTLKATLTPVTSTDKVTWTSSNKKVAKVSGKGVVTAVKRGTATITAKATSGKKVTCKVTVK